MSVANETVSAYVIEGYVCQGITYRKWLIGQIASGAAHSDGTKKIFASFVIARADAIIAQLDAEQEIDAADARRLEARK